MVCIGKLLRFCVTGKIDELLQVCYTFYQKKQKKELMKIMSQAKVDRYKEEKKNRKQTIKKEKRNRVLGRTLGVIIAAAIVCWIGFSGYSYYQEKKPMTKTELSMTALNEYMSNLSGADNATK